MNTEFFAGVNTEKGFIGYLERYFSDAKRLYIITTVQYKRAIGN